MKTNIGFSEIEDYLLGKLTPEESRAVEDAIGSDEELAKIKIDLEAGIKNQIDAEELGFRKDASDALYKRIRKMISKPTRPGAGQVWLLESIGKVLITELSREKNVARFIPLTNDEVFASSSDLKFSDDAISFMPLVAHTALASVTPTKNLSVCFGKIKSEYLKAIKSVEKGIKCRLPKGLISGSSEASPEYGDWEELMKEKLSEIYDQAFRVYAGEKTSKKASIITVEAASMLKKIIGGLGLAADFSGVMASFTREPAVVYNLAAKSAFNKKATAYSSPNLIIEFEDLSEALGINLIFGGKKITALKSVELVKNNESVFLVNNISLVNGIAKIGIYKKDILEKLDDSLISFRITETGGKVTHLKLRFGTGKN